MVTSPPDPQKVAALRGLVHGFIQERLQLKLDKLKGDAAAALDVFKFLKLQHNGQSLWVRLTRQDGAALNALSSAAPEATQWAQAFAGIVDGKGGAAFTAA